MACTTRENMTKMYLAFLYVCGTFIEMKTLEVLANFNNFSQVVFINHGKSNCVIRCFITLLGSEGLTIPDGCFSNGYIKIFCTYVTSHKCTVFKKIGLKL